MTRITRAAAHLEAEDIKRQVLQDPRPWRRQRWLIIYNVLVDPRDAAEIAKHTGTTVAMVHQVISNYNRLGVAAIETPGKGGRHRQYMSLEEERKFFALFFTRATHAPAHFHLVNKGRLTRYSFRLQHFHASGSCFYCNGHAISRHRKLLFNKP